MNGRPKSDRVFLEHILEEIAVAQEAATDRDKDSAIVKRAVIRSLEVIGEASKNLSEELKRTHNHIPWRDMVDFRNVLIHEYFGVSMPLVWQVVENDLPLLKKQIEDIVKNVE